MWNNVLNKQLTIYNSSANFLDPKIELTYDLKYLIFSPHTLRHQARSRGRSRVFATRFVRPSCRFHHCFKMVHSYV